MKSKYLFTFRVVLALIGPTIFLWEESSIAEKTPVASRDRTGKDSKPKTSQSSDPTPVPAPSIIDSPSPSVTTTVSGATTISNNSGNISPLSITAGVLHLLEIAGIAWAYFRISKFMRKNSDEISKLNKKINDSEKRHIAQNDNLKKIASKTLDAEKLTSRIYAIEQAVQKKSSGVSYPSPPPNLSDTTVAKVSTAPSTYPFLDLYRHSPDAFKNQYAPKTVSEDAENFDRRWAGNQQGIILGEERSGNYWLFSEGGLIYLIPVPKLKVNDINMRTVGGLFDCNNHMTGYQSMSIVRPAIVSLQSGVKEQWKLEHKGILEFI
jgi:hypothetical protein